MHSTFIVVILTKHYATVKGCIDGYLSISIPSASVRKEKQKIEKF